MDFWHLPWKSNQTLNCKLYFITVLFFDAEKKEKNWDGGKRGTPVWRYEEKGRTLNKIVSLLFPHDPPFLCTIVCCQTHLSSPLTRGRAESFTLHHWFTPWETSCELQNTLWSNFLKGTSIFTNVFHMIKLWNLSPVWQYLGEMFWGLGRKCLWSALSSTEGKHCIYIQGAIPCLDAILVRQQIK